MNRSLALLLLLAVASSAQDFGLSAMTVDACGLAITPDMAQTFCPAEWQAYVSCVIVDCPQFMDVCPPPQEVAVSVSKQELGFEIPTCEDLERCFCDQYQPEDCCLKDCALEHMDLAACVLRETTGEDHSDCEAPACEAKPEPKPSPFDSTGSSEARPIFCQTNEYNCADAAGNLYGVYRRPNDTDSLSITYSSEGVTFDYAPRRCGTEKYPIIPTLIAPGTIEYRERIEYGLENCGQGAKISLTQKLLRGLNSTWQWVTIANDDKYTHVDPEFALVPQCSQEELDADNWPPPPNPPTNTDAFGNPYGTYSGTMIDIGIDGTVYEEDAVIEYAPRGMFVSYVGEAECGNRLPIVPSGLATGRIEWTDRIDYSDKRDACFQGGLVSLSRDSAYNSPGEWYIHGFAHGVTWRGNLTFSLP